jgi:SAM-dependent methyltransferase
MKDNFSQHAKEYSIFRPTYPEEMFQFIFSLLKNYETAWDCGTGNGQIAIKLADKFKTVYATDISENQLFNALKKDNIIYQVKSAENASFPPECFDLISVGQAIHWFDFEKFYRHVAISLKTEGIIAVTGYGLIRIDSSCDLIIQHLYTNILGKYWDKERKYIDENYQTIPFPFNEIITPTIIQRFKWSLQQLIGYLNTWSAVQHYISVNHSNPLLLIEEKLKDAWGGQNEKDVYFPILMRVGKIIEPRTKSQEPR